MMPYIGIVRQKISRFPDRLMVAEMHQFLPFLKGSRNRSFNQNSVSLTTQQAPLIAKLGMIDAEINARFVTRREAIGLSESQYLFFVGIELSAYALFENGFRFVK